MAGVAKTVKHPPAGAYLALTVTTLALVINFWAWSLLSPLGTRYASEYSLSPAELSILLALPVIVGSLGRIFFGIVADKFGGRRVFATTCLLAMLPVVALAHSQSYSQLLVTALALGIGGVTFVIGIPFVSSWFPPARRGFALGVYSVGNAGTALSGFTTPRLDSYLGRPAPYIIVASLLFGLALAFIFLVKDAPGWKPPKGSSIKRFASTIRNRITWDLSAVYFVTFGAFVAFGVYLPVLLKVAYQLSITDAATRAGGFIVIATLARPIGGWLSDKFGGPVVTRLALAGVVILAALIASQPALEPKTTAMYLSLAFMLGCANGGVFALVGKLAKPELMGSVSGIIGAIGALGGFLPPIFLGITYQKTQTYSFAIAMLSVSAAIVLIYIHRRFNSKMYRLAKRQ